MDVTIFLLMRTQIVVTSRSPMDDLPDSALIRRFLAGRSRRSVLSIQRHTPRLRMIVWRLLGARHEETDDVIQETGSRSSKKREHSAFSDPNAKSRCT